MNILITTYLISSSPSGVVTYYEKLATDLASAGMGVKLIDSSQTPVFWRKCIGVLKRIMSPLGGTSQMLFEEFAYFTCIYFASRKYRHDTFDLIHAQDARSAVATWFALGKKLPIVVSCHFNDNPGTELVLGFKPKPWAVKYLTSWYQYLFSKIKNYVFSSEYAYRLSKHLLPTSINKYILYNSVNLRIDVDQFVRVPSDQFKISNVGYIDERKNQQLLIRAGHELRKRGIANFTIWLVGDGPKRTEYEQLAASLDLSNQVRFYGQYPSPWQLVAQSDLYVHTALNDNCPFAVLEAFAVKTPVIALAVGGVPEMLPADMGLLSETDVDTLTNEIIRSLNPERRVQLTKAQTVFANRRFNHQTNLEHLLAFYKNTVLQPKVAVAHADHVME